MYDLGMTSLYLLWNFIVLTVMFNSAVMCNEVFPQLKDESVSILTSEEASVLHPFLQVLIENTEAGYVLFNQKPVCIYGYGEKDLFYYNSPRYKEEIALKEGIRIWKKFSDSSENQPICIHLCKNEDPSIRGWRHILVALLHKCLHTTYGIFHQTTRWLQKTF